MKKKKEAPEKSLLDVIRGGLPPGGRVIPIGGREYLGSGDNPAQERFKITLPNGQETTIGIDRGDVPLDQLHQDVIDVAKKQPVIAEGIERLELFNQKGKVRGHKEDPLDKLCERIMQSHFSDGGEFLPWDEVLVLLERKDNLGVIVSIDHERTRTITYRSEGKEKTITFGTFENRLIPIRDKIKKTQK